MTPERLSRRVAARRAAGAIPLRPRSIKRCFAMLSSLADLGWHRSAGRGAPVDASGLPIPWFTYSAYLWLQGRLPPSSRVFEYGAGNSTLWFAARSKEVRSVDHDAGWVADVSSRAPRNVHVAHAECRGDSYDAPVDDPYVCAVGDPSQFDVIVVDGRARVACVQHILPNLRNDTLVILDNADRLRMREALALAGARGMERIDFSGVVPGSGRLSTTSVMAFDLSPWLTSTPDLPTLGYEAR